MRAQDSLQSAHLYSDASSVVGIEAQGMVLQLMKSPTNMVNIILPGVALAYGEYGVVDKAIALLWALFLVCGLDAGLIRWLLLKTVSITTDQGSEFAIAGLPDIFPAFFAWLSRSHVDARFKLDMKSVLLPNAVRVAGWGHLLGGLMKTACNYVETWPTIVKGMRILVGFFRVTAWRNRIKFWVGDRMPNVKQLMGKSYPSLAKWRYRPL